MRATLARLSALTVCLCSCATRGDVRSASSIGSWLTTPDGAALFQRQKAAPAFDAVQASLGGPVVEVDDSKTFQVMDGFGFCLTGGSAMLIHRMSAPARAALLKELFGKGEGDIGASFLRVSIGASDLDEGVFSYDDLPAGKTDEGLAGFSLDPDRAHLIPVLKEILAIDPTIKVLGSPWSPPAWMKTNGATKGGSLRPESYGAYARYLVKYVQGMKAEGIDIYAITVQNEPLNPDNNPSLFMPASEQAAFVRDHLGPSFRDAGLKTKILVYDHNADRIDYPLEVLKDPGASAFVAGSAFHLYGGAVEELSKVHDAHPGKDIYFTEQWVGAPPDFAGELRWHVKNLIVGAPRNWCRTVLEWNLAADPEQKPHTEGGCDRCLGAVTLDGDKVARNPAYYIIAHASKHVRPGSVRIGSSGPAGLDNVAFRTPDGRIALVVLNDGAEARAFDIRWRGKAAAASLKPGAVATFVWRP